MLVEDVKRQGHDAAGAEITDVYYRRPPHYAIYRTRDRVLVHFADADEEAHQQDTALAPLNPIRGQINGLIDGWRASKVGRHIARAQRYDRRVADALQLGLTQDAKGALEVLTGIKSDIVDERTARARFAYLIVASGFSIFLVLWVWAVIAWFAPTGAAASLWIGLVGGAIGAFFSIAIAIRNRTVLTDLHMQDNSADAVLRVVVGAISAGVLVAFVALNVVKVGLGDGVFTPTTSGWLFALTLGFLAGFSERLIPDLLAKTAVLPLPAAPPAPPPAPAAPPQADAAPPAAAPAAVDQTVGTPEGANRLDDCLCDHAAEPHEATSDADLPPASGGIAAPRVPALTTAAQ